MNDAQGSNFIAVGYPCKECQLDAITRVKEGIRMCESAI